MNIPKQDRNGTRTTTDVERRYKLGVIPEIEEDVDDLKGKMVVDAFLSATSINPVQNKVITENLNNKVNKESGKGLSTNDFTDDYKKAIENSSSSSHTHANKEALDKYTLPVVLFDEEDGTIEDVTLSEDVATFEYIDIDFGNSSSIHDTKRVYNPDGKDINLSMASCSATSYAQRTENDSIEEKTITRGTRHKFTLNSTGTLAVVNNANITDADKLLIYKVVGYKK